MTFRSTLALALAIAGSFWLATLHNSPIAGLLPVSGARASRSAALVEAAPQSTFEPEELKDIAIYRKVSPSVVNITSQIIQFDMLFGPVPESGQGSGFVIDKNGYILTNYHVIQGARKLTVTWTPQKNQSRQFTAEVVGRAPDLDLAVIKIPASDLPAVTLGDSANLQVGQRVLAIGNPFGLPGTMTQGMISSIRTVRESEGGVDLENAIQVDAPINPGNSGGPLLNSLGEVIGINTMIYSETGSYVGIGFAIPIDSAKSVLDQLMKTGSVQKVALGIQSLPVSPYLAGQLGLSVDHGVLVIAVQPGSPAAAAGLRGGTEPGYIGNAPVNFGGDIITAVNGESIQDQAELSHLLLLEKPGSTITLSVLRGARTLQIPLHLENER